MESFSRTLQIDSHGKASTIKLFSFARPHMRALHLVSIIALEILFDYKDDIVHSHYIVFFFPGMDFIHDGFSLLVLNPAFNINYSS